MVQGSTEDGKRLSDELDINEPNSEDEEDEAGEKMKRKVMRSPVPFVPSYKRMLEGSRKEKGPKNITKSTRSMPKL